MSYTTVSLTHEDGVATITLNRPDRLNAVSVEMYEELLDATMKLLKEKTARSLIITGTGKAFSAGGDQRKDHEFDLNTLLRGMRDLAGAVILNVRNLEIPTIAAVNGPAVGWGFSLAMACDMIIASDKAKFGSVFVGVGLHPDGGAAYFLPRLVGVPRACEMILTGRIIDAQEADKIGLVNRVVPADKLESVAKELAVSLARGPALAISLSKLTIYQGLMMDLPSVLEAETRAQIACLFSEDHKEGVAAFREKRKPQFKGK